MTPVTEVLVRLGQPPPEICLDWAWQLQQLIDVPSQSSSETEPHLALEHAADLLAGWANFAVDSQGILHPCSDSAATTLAHRQLRQHDLIQPLIAELNRWAELDSPGEIVLPNRPSAIAAEEKTAHPPGASSSAFPPAAAQPLTTQHLTTQHLTTQLLSTQQRLASAPSLRRPLRPRRRMGPQHLWRSKHVYYGAGLLLATVGIAVFSATRWPEETRWPADQPTAHDAGKTALHPATALAGPEPAISLTEPARLPLLPATDPADQWTSEGAAAAEPEQSIDLMLSGQEMDLASDRPIELPLALPQPQFPAATADDEHPQPLDSSTLGPVGEPPIDVLRELADLAQTATTQISEHTVNAAADSSLASEQPAWVLEIAAPNQLQAFDKSLRPRQPRWHLRLAATEGFQVSPSEVQSVAGRDWISWVIQEEPSEKSKRENFADFRSSSPTKTEVRVQVQLAYQRQTSLRWRIVAVASDFPGLAIPMDRDWLARAQSTLGLLTQRLSVAVEQTRTLGRAEGLPSAVRSELSAQRRSLETQHKIATRWLEIVADAHQFHGWLDGQLEVHAELFDSAQDPSPAILRFGNP